MSIKVCVFDAYGTLFDVGSAARTLALETGNENLKKSWVKLSDDWRHKQLQYSWLRAIMNRHADFWTVTQDGLDWALEANHLDGDLELRKKLLELYYRLAPYPEVSKMLVDLKSKNFSTAILSNGSPQMLRGAIDSAKIADLLDKVISVEEVGIFKPDIRVYKLLEEKFSCKREEVLFGSSNCWDAIAASEYGFKVVWVNRSKKPVDRLLNVKLLEVSDLSDIPDLIS
jgi:2-haloacid dehalogenase